jgi:short subunit dehydrogenase-like uncharacterized protein
MESKTNIFIYGSYGYTGELICALAQKRGLKPILSGRNAEKLKVQAEKYGFPYEVLDLANAEKLPALLQNVKVVLHCGGPFIHTAKIMAEACLQTNTHYLDITGEWQVFEMLAAMDAQAKKANIMLLPGVGYDVVPSDCLALFLKNSLPDANLLEIVLNNSGSKASRGTKLTVVEGLGQDSAMRKDGKIIPVASASLIKEFTIKGKTRSAMNISWGDIATAWYSTQIPNIITYMSAPSATIKTVKRMNYLGFLLRLPFVKNFMKKRVYNAGSNISEEMRQKSVSQIWASVKNAKGESKTAVITAPDGYLLTAETAIIIAEKVLADNYKVGFQTPAKAYSCELIMEATGVTREVIG